MEIRVTVETRQDKFTQLYKDAESIGDTKTIARDVEVTLLNILDPRLGGLPRLDTPVGFVDAELSQQEYRVLQQFRAATAGRFIDESQYDVTVSVTPNGLLTVPLVQNDGSGANIIDAQPVPVVDDVRIGRNIRVTEPHPEIGLTASEPKFDPVVATIAEEAGIATAEEVEKLRKFNGQQFPGTVVEGGGYVRNPHENPRD